MDDRATTGGATARPPVSLQEHLADATAVFEGTVVEAGAGEQVVRVSRVLKGDLTAGDPVRVASAGAAIAVGDAGLWLVGAGDPHPVLESGPVNALRRPVGRLLAGLPELDPQLGPQEIRDLVDAADLVVWARLTSTDWVTAEAEVLEAFKGDAAEHLQVRVGDQPDQPGGPWRFDAVHRSMGVLFLMREEGHWVALNPTDPRLVRPTTVADALATPPTA